MRAHLLVLPALVLGAAALAHAQVEIDRTLQRVYGTSIMASDVRQVRLLKLVPGGADDEASLLAAIENRLLILREVARAALPPPTEEEIARRRQAWSARWPAGTDLPALMTRAGMTDKGLDGWFRDDLQIEAYFTQRFGQDGDPRRPGRIAEWVRDLRQRANLTVKRPFAATAWRKLH